MNNFEEILNLALKWGRDNYPNAHMTRHAAFARRSLRHASAFANSVTYLVTEASPVGHGTCATSGGYGGPSLREHAVSWSLAKDGATDTRSGITVIYPDGRIPRPGQWSYEKALAFCEPICYGNLPAICKRIAESEYHFDDDPKDTDQLKKL